jgi:hypothetical protein
MEQGGGGYDNLDDISSFGEDINDVLDEEAMVADDREGEEQVVLAQETGDNLEDFSVSAFGEIDEEAMIADDREGEEQVVVLQKVGRLYCGCCQFCIW